MKSSAKRKADPEYIDGPSLLRPQHARDREISPVAGAPRAYRKISPLDRAFEASQISENQFHIAQRYSEKYELANLTGRNLLDPSRVAATGAAGTLPEKRLGARRWLSSVEKSLGPYDISICRMVLGEWWEPCEAIARLFGDAYRRATVPRFQETMKALENAYALAGATNH